MKYLAQLKLNQVKLYIKSPRKKIIFGFEKWFLRAFNTMYVSSNTVLRHSGKHHLTTWSFMFWITCKCEVTFLRQKKTFGLKYNKLKMGTNLSNIWMDINLSALNQATI